MTDRARDLLQRALKQLNPWHPSMDEKQLDCTIREEIREFLASEKQEKREPNEWYEKMRNLQVSMDVSTGEDDANNRIFGEVIGHQFDGETVTILATEESRNFSIMEPEKRGPVAYIQKDQLEKAVRSPMLCAVSPEPRQDRVGIYLQPSTKKREPISESEIYREMPLNCSGQYYDAFCDGVRFAEKHHGIGRKE